MMLLATLQANAPTFSFTASITSNSCIPKNLQFNLTTFIPTAF